MFLGSCAQHVHRVPSRPDRAAQRQRKSPPACMFIVELMGIEPTTPCLQNRELTVLTVRVLTELFERVWCVKRCVAVQQGLNCLNCCISSQPILTSSNVLAANHDQRDGYVSGYVATTRLHQSA